MARVAISTRSGFCGVMPASASSFRARAFMSSGLPYPGRPARSFSGNPQTPYGFGCIEAPSTAPP
jgi:hypothetical protein